MSPSNAIAAIRSLIEQEREALEDDLGPFTLEDDEEHDEVVLIRKNIDVLDTVPIMFRCYETAGRLVYDDYFPTEEERNGT